MYIVVSPAKKLHAQPHPVNQPSVPALMTDIEELATVARQKTSEELQQLMKISEKLGQLNYERFQSFSTPFTEGNAAPAVHSFAGDTYVGLNASTLDDAGLDFAQSHLAILSGLYGVLRPKDLMQPYRLEMGTKMATKRGASLVSFWGTKVTEQLTDWLAAHEDQSLINLASQEYFSVIQPAALPGSVITPVFKEERGGKLKIISFSAKRARGAMARYIIDHRLTSPESIKQFDRDNYAFVDELSTEHQWVFVR